MPICFNIFIVKGVFNWSDLEREASKDPSSYCLYTGASLGQTYMVFLALLALHLALIAGWKSFACKTFRSCPMSMKWPDYLLPLQFLIILTVPTVQEVEETLGQVSPHPPQHASPLHLPGLGWSGAFSGKVGNKNKIITRKQQKVENDYMSSWFIKKARYPLLSRSPACLSEQLQSGDDRVVRSGLSPTAQ